ncbi:MAG: C45 family peptidase [bacterium]|nr:C45 family peptidase [bacterium]
MNGRVHSRTPGCYFIDLWGDDPFERGKAHGELLREEITSIVDSIPIFIRAVARGKLLAWLKFNPPQWLITLTSAYLTSQFEKAGRHFFHYFPEEIQKEIYGLAEGSQQPLIGILLINTFDDIHSAAIACSGVAIKEKDGSFLYGYNLDYFSFTRIMAKLTTVFRIKTSKGSFFSVGVPGYIGILRGMNNHGLAIGYLTSSASGIKNTGIAVGILLRIALTESKTVTEAVDYLSFHRALHGINILLGNADKAIVLESAPKQCAVIEPRAQNGLNVLAITNHYRNPEMQKLQTNPMPLPGLGTPLELYGLAYSQKRLDLLEKQLQETTSGKLADCLRMLKSVCHNFTVSSCLFNPAEQELLLIHNNGTTPATLGAPTSIRLHPLM